MSNHELHIAISFAQLELIELRAGKRKLTECPAIKDVAEFIRMAEGKLNAAADDARWHTWSGM